MNYLLLILILLVSTVDAAPRKRRIPKNIKPPKNVRPINPDENFRSKANKPSPFNDVTDDLLNVDKKGVMWVKLPTGALVAGAQLTARNCEYFVQAVKDLKSRGNFQKLFDDCNNLYSKTPFEDYIYGGTGINGEAPGARNIRISKDLKNIYVLERKGAGKNLRFEKRPLTPEERAKLYFANERSRSLTTGKMQYDNPRYSEALQDLLRPKDPQEIAKAMMRRQPLATLLPEVFNDPKGNIIMRLSDNRWLYHERATGSFSEVIIPGRDISVHRMAGESVLTCLNQRQMKLTPVIEYQELRNLKSKLVDARNNIVFTQKNPCDDLPAIATQPPPVVNSSEAVHAIF